MSTESAADRAAGRRVIPWDGRDDGGVPVGSGVCFYRLTTATQQATRRLLWLR